MDAQTFETLSVIFPIEIISAIEDHLIVFFRKENAHKIRTIIDNKVWIGRRHHNATNTISTTIIVEGKRYSRHYDCNCQLHGAHLLYDSCRGPLRDFDYFLQKKLLESSSEMHNL
nr:hypothetical protein K-LCC10_0260 [Kaumoebavirus]